MVLLSLTNGPKRLRSSFCITSSESTGRRSERRVKRVGAGKRRAEIRLEDPVGENVPLIQVLRITL
jgi:hypothetical protein